MGRASYRLAYSDQVIALPQSGSFSIGRSSECDLYLDDPLLSRKHMVLMAMPERLVLRDVSRHGVTINGRKVQGDTALKDGDRIAFGSQRITVRISETHPSDRPTGEISVEEVRIASRTRERRRRKIVVVDDSTAVCQFLRRLLEAEGFEVTAVTSPITAKAVVEREKPALVLLDVAMPALSGDRIANALKESRSPTKIVFHSSLGKEHLDRVVAATGADGHIAKGCPPAELVRLVRAFLGEG